MHYLTCGTLSSHEILECQEQLLEEARENSRKLFDQWRQDILLNPYTLKWEKGLENSMNFVLVSKAKRPKGMKQVHFILGSVHRVTQSYNDYLPGWTWFCCQDVSLQCDKPYHEGLVRTRRNDAMLALEKYAKFVIHAAIQTLSL